MTVVFETKSSSVFQCDQTESYRLVLDQEELSLKLCDLLLFKRKIEQINIVDLLSSESPDLEIVTFPKTGRIFAFSVYQILELRELLSGAFTMLELNSLIHRQLKRKPL